MGSVGRKNDSKWGHKKIIKKQMVYASDCLGPTIPQIGKAKARTSSSPSLGGGTIARFFQILILVDWNFRLSSKSAVHCCTCICVRGRVFHSESEKEWDSPFQHWCPYLWLANWILRFISLCICVWVHIYLLHDAFWGIFILDKMKYNKYINK